MSKNSENPGTLRVKAMVLIQHKSLNASSRILYGFSMFLTEKTDANIAET